MVSLNYRIKVKYVLKDFKYSEKFSIYNLNFLVIYLLSSQLCFKNSPPKML